MKLHKFSEIYNKRYNNLIKSKWNWFIRKISDFRYWVISHIVPKRRYHMLDLRQPKYSGEYRYGWIDSDSQMLFALFNILNNFVKNEMQHWYCPSEEEVKVDCSLLNHRNIYLETKAIHYWWNVERKRQQKMQGNLLKDWSEARIANSSSENQLWEDLRKAEASFEEKEEEMIQRLIKIRRALWT